MVLELGSWTVFRARSVLVAGALMLAACTSTPRSKEPVQLAFTLQPSNATAGNAMPVVAVTIQDASGKAVMSATNAVTVQNNPESGMLSGTTTVNAINGVATFSDLSIRTAGNYTLNASSGTLSGASSASFLIAPAAPVKVTFRRLSSAAEVSRSIIAQVAIVDAFFNIVGSATNPVTLALGANPGGATLAGTLTVAAMDGIASFSDLSIDRPGSGYTLAATAGTLTGETSGPFSVFAVGSFIAVSAGGNHTCGVTPAGLIYCWGSNASGQLGDGTTTTRTSPEPVSGGLGYPSDLSAGGQHTCVRTSAGVYCWGLNDNGQLGDATTTQRTSPVRIAGGPGDFFGLSAGGSHNCIVDFGSVDAMCWGSNGNGQLGDGTTIDRTSRVVVNNDAVACGPFGGGCVLDIVTAGGFHTCASPSFLAPSSWYCWGSNGSGQLGDGTTIARTTPVAIAGGVGFANGVSAGGQHTCGLTDADAAHCWGLNDNGQLGDGTTTQRTTPVPVAGELSFRYGVSAGGHHTCGVTADRAAHCWGLNSSGQLGDGTTTQRTSPLLVDGKLSFLAVSAGSSHTCGVTLVGTYCWGSNDSGQLGDGSTTSSSVPVRVVGRP